MGEINNGGEMVEATLRMVDANVPFTAVHATRGKVVRAEPVAALYEQEPGRVFSRRHIPDTGRPDVWVYDGLRQEDGRLLT